MKKPILMVTIGYLLGIIGGLSITNGIVLFFLCFLFVCGIGYQRKKDIPLFSVYLLIPFVIATCVTSFRLNDYEEAYSEGKVKVMGIVVSEKEEKPYKDRYKIKVESVNDDYHFKGKNLFINCKKGKEKEVVSLEYGDRIYFEGEYEKPTKRRNKGGFDYASYLRSIGIYGNVTIEGKIKVIKKGQISLFSKLAYQFRKSIRNKVQSLLGGEKGSLLLGLLIGDVSGVSEQTKEYFRDSSLSHLLAVSGAQVSYILMGIEAGLQKIKIGKQKSRIIAMLVLVFFLEVTGFSASVTRAGIMGIIGLIAGMLHRKNNTWNSFFFSLLLLMLANPFCIFDLGLQLSFAGTAGILLFQKKRKANEGKKEAKGLEKLKDKLKISAKEMLTVTVAAQIMIFPITLYQFGTVSFTFFLSNLLAGLLIGPITLFGCIFCFSAFFFFPLAKLVSTLLRALLTLLMTITKYSSFLPLAKQYVSIPSFFVILLYYFLLLYLTCPIFKNNRKKVIKHIRTHLFEFCSCISILVVLCMVYSFAPHDFRLHFIDVGQGDSTLLISPYGKTMLIDGGGSRQEVGFNVGEQVLLPYLLHRKVNVLDYVMISHFDSDHCNGLLPVLENLQVKCVIIAKQASSSQEFLRMAEVIQKKKIKVWVVEAGMEFDFDKTTRISILHPQKKLLQDGKGGLNCNAIVAKVTCRVKGGEKTVLFTGDIEEEAEEVLIDTNQNLKADILKVGHHGSKTSTTANFLKAVNPKIALIGVGEKNTFGHPNPQVIKRLEEEKIKIYRTDQDGEVSLRIKSNGKIKIETQIKK